MCVFVQTAYIDFSLLFIDYIIRYDCGSKLIMTNNNNMYKEEREQRAYVRKNIISLLITIYLFTVRFIRSRNQKQNNIFIFLNDSSIIFVDDSLTNLFLFM